MVGIDGCAGHPFKGFPDTLPGYFLRPHLTHNVSALTGALMMFSKSDYQQVNGLDEDAFSIAYNDVDFCLKLLEKGKRNLLEPACLAIALPRTRFYRNYRTQRRRAGR